MDSTIEERLNRIRDLYFNLDKLVDGLPDAVPDEMKKKLKEMLLENEELKRTMQGLEEARPPRFLMVGRTGVGKSSLINAMCGMYVAEVSDVKIGTRGIERKECHANGRVLMEILDSRGIGESVQAPDGGRTAEDELQEKMLDFRPDAIIFVERCKARDRLNEDILYVRKLREKYERDTGVEIPVLAVLNQADEMEPSQYKKDFPHRKIENIQQAEQEFERLLEQNRLKVIDVIAAASRIDWGYSSEELAGMSEAKLAGLKIQDDGRYNIDKLIDRLESSLEVDAAMGLLKAADVEGVLDRIAMKLVKIFASVAAMIAATPIPLSDIVILTALQACMVETVAYISGEKLSIKAAEKFIASVLGVGLGGNIFKMAARQLVKILPGFGNAVSAAVAYSGTYSMGRLAVQYYIHGIDMKKLKREQKALAEAQ